MNALSAQSGVTDYLSLLTVQLQNQDPIDPVDQQGLINDLTQFSILEGIQNLNASFEEIRQLQELSQGLSLVGQEIQFIDPLTGYTKSGTVQHIFTSASELRVLIDDQTTIGVGQITSVGQSKTGS
jgi:flagellar basal-body rod modification protein FlgD